jgi:hypothetical protein
VDFDEALMYRRRSAAGDRTRAASITDVALEQFRALGMTGWIRRGEALLAECCSSDTESRARQATAEDTRANARVGEPSDLSRGASDTDLLMSAEVASAAPYAAAHAPRVAVLRREGDYWTVVYAESTSRLRDMKGLAFLGHLLRHPGREFHALDLIRMQTAGSVSEARADHGIEVLDPQAKAAYRRRLEELRAELDEAEDFNDSGRAERAREEMEAIAEHLASAVGLGGRDRKAGSAAERARTAVTQRVRSAIKRIAEQHPALADHLAGRIETGTFCIYRPDPTRPIEWDLD